MKPPPPRAVPLALLFLLALGPLTLHAQTNLVPNGSFESGPAGQNQFTSWNQFGPANNNSNFGVAKSGASPDVAQHGTNYAYFRGHPTDDSQDCLGTTVHLKVG